MILKIKKIGFWGVKSEKPEISKVATLFFDFINDESMEILNRFCFKIAKKFYESGFIKGEIKC